MSLEAEFCIQNELTSSLSPTGAPVDLARLASARPYPEGTFV